MKTENADLSEKIALRLVALRGSRGQSEIAKASGISLSYVKKMEDPNVSNPSVRKLQKYLKPIKASMCEFFEVFCTDADNQIINRSIHRQIQRALGKENTRKTVEHFVEMLQKMK